MGLWILLAFLAHAAPTQKSGLLDGAPKIAEIQGGKEIMVPHEDAPKEWEPFSVYVVARQVPDSKRPGWWDFQFVGRAAVVDGTRQATRLVVYKTFGNEKPREDDRLIATGDPLTAEEMDLLR